MACSRALHASKQHASMSTAASAARRRRAMPHGSTRGRSVLLTPGYTGISTGLAAWGRATAVATAVTCPLVRVAA